MSQPIWKHNKELVVNTEMHSLWSVLVFVSVAVIAADLACSAWDVSILVFLVRGMFLVGCFYLVECF